MRVALRLCDPHPYPSPQWGGDFALCHPRPALRETAHVLRARRAVVAEAVEALGEIDGVAAEAPLNERRGEVRGIAGAVRAALGCEEHHPGEARRQRQRAQAPSGLGDAPIDVEGAEL